MTESTHGQLETAGGHLSCLLIILNMFRIISDANFCPHTAMDSLKKSNDLRNPQLRVSLIHFESGTTTLQPSRIFDESDPSTQF